MANLSELSSCFDLCLLMAISAIYDFCVFFNGVEKNWKVEQQKLGKKLVRSESAKACCWN
jgi:hypothetical protein